MMNIPPLAERLRPISLDDYVGQEHLVAPGKPLYEMLASGLLRSFILWGPPGVGKTTLAQIVAKTSGVLFFRLNAVNSGVKEIRDILSQAEQERQKLFYKGTPILFIDEIHRFSKSQQDSLLSSVERGIVTLIGATTENPSFEIIQPLLSRCRVFTLEPLGISNLQKLLNKAITTDPELKKYHFSIEETEALFASCGGDARKLLNSLEVLMTSPKANVMGSITINNEVVLETLQKPSSLYDKGGEMHYDIASAFIKSIRGGDPDAALYWMARMIEGGESPEFIARRIVISAAEDIGLANPNALLIANAAFDAVHRIGWPEGRIPLAEAVIYLATSPKSNSAYKAINDVLQFVKESPSYPVPLHLRNAPTKLMRELGYGENYLYPHDYNGHYVSQTYLPEEMKACHFWEGQDNAQEQKMMSYIEEIKKRKE